MSINPSNFLVHLMLRFSMSELRPDFISGVSTANDEHMMFFSRMLNWSSKAVKLNQNYKC